MIGPLLVPSPGVRVVKAADGLRIWLVIPHSLRGTSFLLEAPGILWCTLWLINEGNAQDQCWLARLDCATGDLSVEPLNEAYAFPSLVRDPTGAPVVLAQDGTGLRRAAAQPLTGPSAVRWSALPKGEASLAALGPDGPLAWITNSKTYRTTHLAVDRGAATPTLFELPRGFTLLHAIPTASGYALLGSVRRVLRWLTLDASLALVSDHPVAATDASPQAIVRAEPDGSLLALGRRGRELGSLRLSPGESPRFSPIVEIPVAGLDEASVHAPSGEPDGAFGAPFSFRYAGKTRSGSGSLRVAADGTLSSLWTSLHDSAGLVHRGPATEQICDDPLRIDFHGKNGDFEVAAFDRSWNPESGYARHPRLLIRVWRG